MEPGRYLGLCPSPKSPLFYGEAELIIDGEGIRMRLATGHTVITLFEWPLDSLAEMDADEVVTQFIHRRDSEGVRGWRISDTPIRLLLLPELERRPRAPRLIVRRVPREKDPAMLFLPHQAEDHERNMAGFEREVGLPIGVPRLALGGRPPMLHEL